MSDLFAEATVRVTPSLTGFVKDLNEQLATAMAKVKVPPVRVRPALTRDFVGDLRRQVNAAIAQAQRGVKPIVIRTVVQTPSRRALADLVSAPVSLGAVTGHVTPTAGPAGGISAQDQETINRLLKGNVQLLGLQEVAEENVTKARRRSNATAKVTETRAEQQARANKLAAEATKTLENAQFRAATRTGELAQAQTELTEASKAVALSEKALGVSLTKSTREANVAAKAAQSLALERVRAIEQRVPAAGAPRLPVAQARARSAGIGALREAVTLEREAAVAAAQTGKSVKDLAAQRDILTQRTTALARAEKAVKSAVAGQSSFLQQVTTSVRDRIRADVEQQKNLVKGLREQEKAASAAARTEKRRSEQLSRGGQASILSLAGIRGATLAASRSFLAGAAAVTIFANAVRQFADLERNLHVFEATMGATEQQMEAVREEARLLGADLTLPSVTAGDAAGAMVELAKAGLSVEDSLAAARSVLQLATAAAIDNAEATRLVTNVLNAFSLAGTEARDVADTLANAANAAQGSIADIGTAFQQAASAGRQVGLSFQDTAAFLTILAKNGIRGSDAGTSLRTALIRLINPSKKAKETFQELGIEIHNTTGELRPDVFLQIAAATREMTPAARDATIALIGGQDAFRAVTILGRQSADSFIAMRRALREEGTAAELAAARTKGLHGSIDALQSVVETVGTTMASNLGPGLADFVYNLGRGITALSESDAVATTLDQTLQSLASAFDLLGAAIKTVSVVALPVAQSLNQLLNFVGVQTILAAVVAYKAFGGALTRVTSLVTKARAAYAALAAAQVASTAAQASGLIVVENFNKSQASVPRALSKSRLALTALTSSFNIYLVAAAAAAAAIVFLVTRESDLEKTRRRLTDQTNRLVDAQAALNQARAESERTALGRNRAELDRLLASRDVAAAQSALANSDAARGTFERTKLELQLKIAIDDAQAADQNYARVVREATQAREAALVASRNARREREREIEVINDLVDASREQLAAIGSRDPRERQRQTIRLVSAELDKQILKLEELNTVESRAQAKRLARLKDVSTALGRVPSEREIEIALTTPNVANVTRRLLDSFGILDEELRALVQKAVSGAFAQDLSSATRSLVLTVRDSLFEITGQAEEAGRNSGDAFSRGLDDSIPVVEAAANRMGNAFADALRRSAGRRAGLEIQEDLAAIASGATGSTLPILQQQLAQATRDRQRAEARIAQLERTGDETGLATAREERRRAIGEQRRLTEEIRGINEQLANEAESAAREAESKQDEIFSNLLKAMGLKREAQQRRIEDAQLSESKADDIRQTQILRKIAAQQIRSLKERIENARKQGLNVETLVEGLKDLRDIWRDLGREVVSLQRQQQAALRDILFERFELRIQIAQARQDVAAEIRIRRQKLEALTKELVRLRKTYGKNSIEWLRAKAAQAEEVAAIQELEKQVNERNNAFAELSFAFLTTQQGFAANLLGNLLPGASVAGTLGGTAPSSGSRVGSNISGAGTLAGAASFGGGLAAAEIAARTGRDLEARGALQTAADAGPTRGQATVELDLLRQILRTLREIQGGKKFPENKQQRASSGAAMDVM